MSLVWALGTGLGPLGCQYFPAGNWASLSQYVCVCVISMNTVFQAVVRIHALHYTLTKAGMKGHMPLLFKVTDEVDSWTDVVHSCLKPHSLRCDFCLHFNFL